MTYQYSGAWFPITFLFKQLQRLRSVIYNRNLHSFVDMSYQKHSLNTICGMKRQYLVPDRIALVCLSIYSLLSFT